MNYTTWSFQCEDDEQFVLYPDGCCDLIVASAPGSAPLVRSTALDFVPRTVELSQGMTVSGFRLKPGLSADAILLEPDTLQSGCPDQIVGGIQSMLDAQFNDELEITLIVEALASGGSVKQVAGQSGVSCRSLQRRFRQLNLPKPEFWMLLGRARRAVASLPLRVKPGEQLDVSTTGATSRSLAEIAYEHGFSDQSHLTRECQRWFRQSPDKIRDNRDFMAQLANGGLGNWVN